MVMYDFNKAGAILRKTGVLTLKDFGGSKGGDGDLFAARSGCPPTFFMDRSAKKTVKGAQKLSKRR